MGTIIIFIIYLPLAILVANEGNKKSVGFGAALAISLIFSPLVGYLVVMQSGDKRIKMPPHKVKRSLGESAEASGDHKRALKLYKESLFHLENDYQAVKLPKQSEDQRLFYLTEIKDKISMLEEAMQEK